MMERVLLKLAQQLNQYDESSLMELWNEYARKVADFEPSARWEEYALVFCMIQAVHWKNQLFNAELAASARRGREGAPRGPNRELRKGLSTLTQRNAGKSASPDFVNDDDPTLAGRAPSASARGKKGCKVLVFRPGDAGEPG